MLVTSAAIWQFVTLFTRFFRVPGNSALVVGIAIGIIVGAIVTRANSYIRRRVIQRIDRAFFRSAYDASQVLEHLAQETRRATGRGQLAELLKGEISEALHPASVAVYLEASDGRLRLERNGSPLDSDPPVWTNAAWLDDVARRGEPVDLPPAQAGDGVSASPFGPVQPGCLVAGNGHVAGLVALGARLSEEPYSREDKRLLASVAGQAGLALESIRLGEKIAERMEAERSAAQEMEFAREVQARLFPQKMPALRTLEYAGGCVQARQVGGDYYDFLELGPGRVALVLADIAGKGVSGALLMANLQANLRSQYALALDDLPRLLGSVNHLFFENTAENSYATLFFCLLRRPDAAASLRQLWPPSAAPAARCIGRDRC